MTWEYRVLDRDGELAIYEVHHDEHGRVQGYGADPTFPAAATLEELRVNCDLYLAALDKPILKYE
ncbi:hypothetical protein [Variovorax sp. OK605]|uniref:hypothetical protein n=1 Tax=Variovorax sp. OK605 TaxID=1855317 RepID=UPI000B819C00|nr:hypothetical protein [Variovorax sp. OK605]